MCILIVRLAEELIYFFAGGGSLSDYPSFLVERFSWPRFLSIQIWLMVLFLLYVTIHELNMLFGDGELYRLFFRWRSSEAKLTRRRRIRLLAQLNPRRDVIAGAFFPADLAVDAGRKQPLRRLRAQQQMIDP